MSADQSPAQFQSILAPLLEKFIQEKRACGYRYDEEARVLGHLDLFLSGKELRSTELPRPLTRQFLSKRFHESSGTHRHRITIVRQFAKFLLRLGYPAYVPDSTLAPRDRSSFAPRILTHEEIRKLLQAVDQFVPMARSPLRHLIMPEIFRLLYGCGFRLGEVLNLQVRDVDLNQGVLTVRQGKFRKGRLVPPALSLVTRLRKYAASLGDRPPNAVFFPAPVEGRIRYGPFTLYSVNCYSSVGFRMQEGARGLGFMMHVTRSQFIPCCVGIERERTSMPNCRFWPPTWAIRISREPRNIFI